MRAKVAWLIGLLSAINGVFMMTAPAAWYRIFPGVVQSGPFNGHFIRDIGAAFLVAGMGFVWFANDSRARPAALAAAAFFALHALIHIGDAIAGRESLYHAALDAPTAGRRKRHRLRTGLVGRADADAGTALAVGARGLPAA